jgi:hypothetical protein
MVNLTYEVRLEVSPQGVQEPKTMIIEIEDMGDERLNKVLVLTQVGLKLDDEGIKHWTLKTCNKVTS